MRWGKTTEQRKEFIIYGKNRVKEVRRREKGGLKLTDNSLL